MNRIWIRYLLLVSALLLVSCGGGGLGCSGCASSCGGNPNYKFKGSVAKDSVQVRMTQSGVDFITDRIKPIIESLLKKAGQSFDCNTKGVVFPTQSLGNGPKVNGKSVPPTGGNCGIKVKGLRATCTGSTPSSTWFYAALQQSSLCGQLNAQAMKVTMDEPRNSVKVTFNIPEVRVRSNAPDIGFCYKGKVSIIPGDICAGAKANLKKVELLLKNLGVEMRLKFSTDPNTGKVGLKLDDVQVNSGTKFTVKLDGCQSITIPINIPLLNRKTQIKLGGRLCSVALKGIEGIINGTRFIQPIIFRLLGGVIKSQFSNLDLLAEAKVEMEVPLGATLGGLGLPSASLAQATPLGLLIRPGKALGISNGGLTMGMDSGFEATTNNPCVPVRPQPRTQPGPPPSLSGNYHMAAALSRAATNRALWAAYQTGVLCIKLKSSDLGSQLGGFELNAGVLALLAPELSKVVPQDAPIMIAIQPTQPPDATFGAGVKVGGKLDPSIKLRIPDFGVSFYVMLHDRYVRVFKMLIDMKLGVSLISSPANELEIAIDSDSIELTNARAKHAYLVKVNDPKSLLKLVVGLISQTLGSNGLSFPIDFSSQLSQALGIPIGLKINGVGKTGAAGDWLALRMTLTSKGLPLLPTPHTMAQLHQPAGMHVMRKGKIIPTGEVLIDVPSTLGIHPLEYQYRIGSGIWSTFHTPKQGVLHVRSPLLKVLGKHKIWIRARIEGHYHTRESQPALVQVKFDPVAPQVGIKKEKDHLHIIAQDQVTPVHSLRYAYLDQGNWVQMDGPRLTLPKHLQNAKHVSIRVIDDSGNARTLQWSMAHQKVVGGSQTKVNTGQQAALGCSSIPSEPADSTLWLLILGVLGWGVRKRRSAEHV